MEVSNLAFAFLAKELGESLSGARVKKIQEITNKMLKFRIQGRKRGMDLIVCEKAAFITSYKIPAKKSTSGFGAFLNKQLAGSRIEYVSQHNMDRVLVIGFERKKLVLEFLSEFNIILVDENNKIISALRKQRWKARTISKNKEYIFPSSSGLHPLNFSIAEGKEKLNSGRELVSSLIKGFNIPPFVAEAACETAGCRKEADAGSIRGKKGEEIFDYIRKLYKGSGKKPSAYKLLFRGKEFLFPHKIELFKKNMNRIGNSINDAIDTDVSAHIGKDKHAKSLDKIDKELYRTEFSLKQQSAAQKKFENGITENKQKAEWIYRNFNEVEKLIENANELKKQNLTT